MVSMKFVSIVVAFVIAVAVSANAGNPPKNTGKASVPKWVKPEIEFDDDTPGRPRADVFAPPDFGTRPVSSVALAESLPQRGVKAGVTTTAIAGSAKFRFVVPLNVPGGALNHLSPRRLERYVSEQ